METGYQEGGNRLPIILLTVITYIKKEPSFFKESQHIVFNERQRKYLMIKIKTDNGYFGIFIKKIKGKEVVIVSIITEDGLLVEELHIAISKKQAVKFLKRALEEIGD